MRLLSLALSFCLLSPVAMAQPATTLGAHLPPGPGRDLMIRVCSKCHDPDLAADQDLNAAGWKELVNQMASNGASATDDEFAQIEDYLTKSFPEK